MIITLWIFIFAYIFNAVWDWYSYLQLRRDVDELMDDRDGIYEDLDHIDDAIADLQTEMSVKK